MAEESSDPLVTSEEKVFNSMNLGINSGGNPRSLNNVCRRASVGSYRAGNNARRRHSACSNSENVSRRVVPRYLRASTGSCHDLCKFGRRQSCEEKVKKPLRRRTAKISPNELLPVVIVAAGKQKTEKVIKHEPPADLKKRLRVVKPSPDAKSYSSKFKASMDAKVCSPTQNASSSNETRLPNSPTKKSTPSHPTAIIKRGILSPYEKVEVPLKEANSIERKISRTGKKTYDQSLKCTSVKSESINVKRSPASDNLDGVLGKGRRNSVVKSSRGMTASTASARRASVTPAAPLFPKSSPSKTASIIARKSGRVKLLSPLKVRTRIQRTATETSNNENSEKTLLVITMGTEKLEDIPDDHAIASLSSSSSPKSLSHAKSASSLSCEVEEEEVKYSGHKADELVSDNTVSNENGSVLAVKENQDKTSRMGTENNSLESIPDYHVIPALSSPSSPKSLSHAKSPSLLSHEEDNEETKNNGNKAVEFVLEKTISVEIGNTQTIKENQNKMPGIRTEKRALESIPEDHATALPSPSSPKSLSHANSPSLEEHDVIKHNGNEADGSVSNNIVSVEIGNVQPLMGDQKKTMRKSRLVLSEDKYCSPLKLRFRSGKVVDLPSENNTPRRLIFRRSRSSGNKAAEGFVSDNKKSVEMGTLEPVRENQDKILRKSRVVVSEHKPRSPVKSFRNQQAVDVHWGNNSTRILRFRRPKVVWPEDGKVDLKRRICKKTGDKDDAAGAELCSGKVILKHQDVQGKTDVKILLNNVLEETASKLVESRKGKVKALVGAFETVISLHERKRTLSVVS
ncbi:muscle M-line assembly protein unc-89-like [Sesamum indicum]|uniref:Muscle M-line assembly protein unc-89-like n=1 Tax=Sesamum indicum TaxID=4182 RepID=A0A6I9TQE1_SESIN|nr:muscle M-line assembly protein unc-89-like [Sesamum indicum]XP_020551419.1 muscle M-line assembly protein unc-89-like [Sesamum indicum]XP_020551420.1 muscle M-line assembly protein unc-89-like [Sesamum indicum]